jgi:hypothetical protein
MTLLSPFTWLYAPFSAPAAFVVAVLGIALAPYLSLIVLAVVVLATAAAVAGVAASVIAAPLLVARAVRRRRPPHGPPPLGRMQARLLSGRDCRSGLVGRR